MKRVEKKGFNSKREMEIMDALNEVKMLNKRLSKVDVDDLLLDLLEKHDDAAHQQEEATLSKSTRTLNGGLTDEELKQKFNERQKFKRIEDKTKEEDIDEYGVVIVQSTRAVREMRPKEFLKSEPTRKDE